MLIRMLRKDLVRNRAIHITLCLFIMLASMLIAGAFGVIANMSQAMDSFFMKAKPLHYMQMVSGEIDQKTIDDFSASNELVLAQQTLELLGVDNNYIYYGENPEPYSDSIMENSFVTQSPHFDFLLDENNEPVSVNAGEIAVPVYAIDAYDLKLGDSIFIKDGDFEVRFTVASFLRDSQMNPSLVSSKRFVINQADYNLLKENTGEVEYLIEFQLTDLSRLGEFDAQYLAAGLPSGITITLPVLQLMNAMTEGLAIVVLVLASLLLIVIALLCLRFIIMATLEEEYTEIGVMKAIGLAPSRIAKLYKIKYFSLGALSCFVGFLLSFLLSSLFTQSLTLYMGAAPLSIWSFVLPLLGALLVCAIIMGFCLVTLRKLRKISVVDAIRGTGALSRQDRQGSKTLALYRSRLSNVNISLGLRDAAKRVRSYLMPITVFILCTFLIIVPVNFLATLNSDDFIGYTGVGQCDAIITLRYSDDIESRYSTVLETLAQDSEVSAFAGQVTAIYKAQTPTGSYENINIQNGDFASFPIPYVQGAAPIADDEIALSLLNARDYEKGVGDTIDVLIDGKTTRLTVCGIYQDLTNGGKSAQAHVPYQSKDVLWYSVCLSFAENADAVSKIESFSELFAPAKVIDIDSYFSQTFASTIRQFEQITLIVSLVSIAVAILITALFVRMILVKDRRRIIIMKCLGFTSSHIRTQYVTALIVSLLIGLIVGTIAANTLGESLVGLLMSNMGASRISFVFNPFVSLLICPALLLLVVMATTFISAKTLYGYENHLISE